MQTEEHQLKSLQRDSCEQSWLQDFMGQVAIVTGAAQGIGLAVATALAKRGAIICLVDLSEDALRASVTQIKIASPESSHVIFRACDVTNAARTVQVVKEVVSQFGRIDILVQAAGITGITNVKTEDVDPTNFDNVVRVNLRGIFLMCRAVLPIMARQKYGRICNIASIAGKEGNAGMLAYSASKAAVIGLTSKHCNRFAFCSHVRRRPASISDGCVYSAQRPSAKNMQRRAFAATH